MGTLSLLFFVSVMFTSSAAQESAYCPCNFNFTKDVLNDPSCYGSVPLIAGIKDIELDEKIPKRNQTLNLNKVMEVTCAHYGAFPLMLDDSLFAEYKTKFVEFPNLFYSIFFNVPANEQENKDFASMTNCGFFYDINRTHIEVAKGTCNSIIAENRKVIYALCINPPIDGAMADSECGCPCSFWLDKYHYCTRDVQRCWPINNTDDMVATCSMVQTQPAIVVRARNVTEVSMDWIQDSLFFIGESTNNYSFIDNVECGYISSGSDEPPVEPGTFRWSNGITCNDWLEEEYKNHFNEFFLVLCTTTEVNLSLTDVCDPTDLSQVELDEPDCGAMATFGQYGIFTFTISILIATTFV